MKISSSFGILFLFALSTAQAEDATPAPELLNTDFGKYSVSVLPKQKKVEVTRVNPGDAPPYIRLKVLRQNAKPLEVHLHAMEGSDLPKYEGDLSQWNNSYLGFKLEFSFDKKKWKRVGHPTR